MASQRPTVDDGYGNVDNAIQVDRDTGLLKKTPRPGMGTIMARERVGKTPAQHYCCAIVWYINTVLL